MHVFALCVSRGTHADIRRTRKHHTERAQPNRGVNPGPSMTTICNAKYLTHFCILSLFFYTVLYIFNPVVDFTFCTQPLSSQLGVIFDPRTTGGFIVWLCWKFYGTRISFNRFPCIFQWFKYIFGKFLKPTIRHLHTLHTENDQMCTHLRGATVWTLEHIQVLKKLNKKNFDIT